MTARPLVSVNLPCYRQLSLNRRAVETIRAQSFGNLEITLLDDGASDEYRHSVESLGDPRVRYVRNRERLGAMRNMFAAIESGSGQYTMAFHEDDLLSAGYIEQAVGILERESPVRVRRVRTAGILGRTDRGRARPARSGSGVRRVRVRRRPGARHPPRRQPDVRLGRLPPVGARTRAPGSRSVRHARRSTVSPLDHEIRLVGGRRARADGVVSPSRRRRHGTRR